MVDKFHGQLTINAPLARLNTWRVGGAAKQLYQPADLADLCVFIQTLKDEPIFLGLGSNVLIRDSGIDTTVILTQAGLKGLALIDTQQFRAEAGVTCAKAAKFCVKNNFIDAEFFAGIPGTIGGALLMNAGAFGRETWEYVIAVETIDQQGKIRKRFANDYQIAYRSVKGPGITYGEKEWFVAAHFKLPIGNGQQTAANIKTLLKQRNQNQPIGLPSCGSVFTNPIADHAARLIEVSGLKGYTIGGAQVSEKHANFIINTGNAAAKDIETLILTVQAIVLEQQKIKLIPEVKILGEQ